MSRADNRRAQIIERLTDFLLAEGLMAASLRPLAAAAGTSDRMLLYYFADKEAIVTAILHRAAERLAERLSGESRQAAASPDALEAELLAITASPELWPYMCLWLEVAALASRGDELYRAIGHQVAIGFQHWIASRLAIDDADQRSATALRILMRIDGAMLLRTVGVPIARR